MFKSLISIVSSRFLWGMVGISTISLIIWFISPFISIGGYRPFESPVNRVIAIVVIWVVWLLIKLIAIAWRARFSAKKAESKVQESVPKEKTSDLKLAERFEEATSLLKKAYINQKSLRSLPHWLWYFNKHYIYQQPWYVLLGAKGAGKTTALVNSGIPFPLVDRFGKTMLKNIVSTRNCDWWFADNAVLLDTAGHYSMPNNQEENSNYEWKGFLGLLKKYRPRQPINGAIVTISLADLMNRTPEECLEQAQAEHKRLVELRDSLKIDFPIYVMITKVDLLRGFLAYFEKYSAQQREQIWGSLLVERTPRKQIFLLFQHMRKTLSNFYNA